MRKLIGALGLSSLYDSIEMRPTVILLGSLTLVAVHRYFGKVEFAKRVFPSISGSAAADYEIATAFVLFALIPLTLVLLFRESGRDYGLRLGDWKFGIIAVAILFPLIAGSLYLDSKTAAMQAAYPIDKAATQSIQAFLRLEIPCLLFLMAWEFIFRGFMLFGLRSRVGVWLAICIQTIPSSLWHIGLPVKVTLAAIPAGIMFGLLAIRTNSLIWPILLHYLIWVGLDLFVALNQ